MHPVHGRLLIPVLIVVTQGVIFPLCRRSKDDCAMHNKRSNSMMTRPIQYFDSLTSESTPAGGNTIKTDFSFNERRLLEARARYARAEMAANVLTDAILWVAKQYTRLVAAVKADFKLRAAEAQL